MSYRLVAIDYRRTQRYGPVSDDQWEWEWHDDPANRGGFLGTFESDDEHTFKAWIPGLPYEEFDYPFGNFGELGLLLRASVDSWIEGTGFSQ